MRHCEAFRSPHNETWVFKKTPSPPKKHPRPKQSRTGLDDKAVLVPKQMNSAIIEFEIEVMVFAPIITRVSDVLIDALLTRTALPQETRLGHHEFTPSANTELVNIPPIRHGEIQPTQRRGFEPMETATKRVPVLTESAIAHFSVSS